MEWETLVSNCSNPIKSNLQRGYWSLNSRTWAPIIVFHQSWQAIRGTVCIEFQCHKQIQN